jgi:hypothetical protein
MGESPGLAGPVTGIGLLADGLQEVSEGITSLEEVQGIQRI